MRDTETPPTHVMPAPAPAPAPPPERAQLFQILAARKTVDEAASAARLVGGVFVVLGSLLIVTVVLGRIGISVQVLAVATGAILIGPGAWFVLAAPMIRRLERRAATIGVRVAAVQGVLVAVGLVIAGSVDARDALSGFARPALLAIFFVPALAALIYQLRRAAEAMNHLGGGQIGFEALAPRRVLPLHPADVAASHPDPSQGSESFRAK